MEPLLRGSKSWKCSDTLILLVCTCSWILATNSPTSTSAGGWWGDRGEGSGGLEGRDSNLTTILVVFKSPGLSTNPKLAPFNRSSTFNIHPYRRNPDQLHSYQISQAHNLMEFCAHDKLGSCNLIYQHNNYNSRNGLQAI